MKKWIVLLVTAARSHGGDIPGIFVHRRYLRMSGDIGTGIDAGYALGRKPEGFSNAQCHIRVAGCNREPGTDLEGEEPLPGQNAEEDNKPLLPDPESTGEDQEDLGESGGAVTARIISIPFSSAYWATPVR